MKDDLTKIINDKIASLKDEVRCLPGGGGLEVLETELQHIQNNINSLIQKINEIEHIKGESHDNHL